MEETPKHITIKLLAEDDRPREKLSAMGRHTLSDAELIAIILASGNNNVPARIKITLTEKNSDQVIGTYFSHPTTGKFFLVVNPLKSYKAVAEAESGANMTMEIAPLATETDERTLQFNLKKDAQ